MTTTAIRNRWSDVIPLAGSRTRAQLNDLLGALDLSLTEQYLRRIEAAVPPEAVAGDRYDERRMATLDSERA